MTRPFRPASAVLALALLIAMPAYAQTPPAQPQQLPASFTIISPIFSQLVRFSIPSTFVTAFENVKDNFYIREAVLKGETVQNWTQMITVTGTKDLAANPKVTPQAYAASLAGGFKKACPETFVASPLGATRIGEHDAFAVVIGCGRPETNPDKPSETALVIVVKGSADLYSLQWAERTASPAGKPAIDVAAWQARLRQLSPIRLCAIVPGERAPYPSCINAK